MKFEKKDFVYIGIIIVMSFIFISGFVGSQNALYKSETELANAESQNIDLGGYLTTSLDRTAELEQQNSGLRKTVDGIRGHAKSAFGYIDDGLSETTGIIELINSIEKAFIEIEKAIYFPDNY